MAGRERIINRKEEKIITLLIERVYGKMINCEVLVFCASVKALFIFYSGGFLWKRNGFIYSKKLPMPKNMWAAIGKKYVAY